MCENTPNQPISWVKRNKPNTSPREKKNNPGHFLRGKKTSQGKKPHPISRKKKIPPSVYFQQKINKKKTIQSPHCFCHYFSFVTPNQKDEIPLKVSQSSGTSKQEENGGGGGNRAPSPSRGQVPVAGPTPTGNEVIFGPRFVFFFYHTVISSFLLPIPVNKPIFQQIWKALVPPPPQKRDSKEIPIFKLKTKPTEKVFNLGSALQNEFWGKTRRFNTT